MIISIALILIGFVILMFGGETLVNGAVAVAKRLGLPSVVIGVVLVGFGTSVPELVTSLEATLQGAPGIAVGNVVGSNIANVLLVAGVGALLIPVTKPASGFWRDSIVLTGATLMFVAAALAGEISRGLGVLFLTALVLYVTYLIVSEQRKKRAGLEVAIPFNDDVTFEPAPKSLTRALVYTFGGIALTILGAKLLVLGATQIALALGVTDTVIGLTVVAIGTSLPELATAIIAGRKGESDVSMGNIIGSNIYNLLAILGITAMVQPLAIDPSLLKFDLWVMAGTTALVMAIPLVTGRINRITGAVFAAGYAGYLFTLYMMMS